MSDISDNLSLINDPGVLEKVTKAISLLQRATTLYSAEKLSFSFNGGKDSTVLLHLLRAAISSTAHNRSDKGSRNGLGGIRTFYFEKEDDFAEVNTFVKDMDTRYNLEVDYITNPDFKKGLQDYIASTGIAGIVLGTRRGDPNARDQEFFCPSSHDWPAFMRINPILDWTYRDVWTFLRCFTLPYCQLYDQGYTSLGSRHNTCRNRALQMEDGSFAPAHQLPDGRLERAGRGTFGAAAVAAAAAGRQAGKADRNGIICSASTGTAAPEAGTLSESGTFAHTAAILVVGDEILTGKVEDCNTSFLCSELHMIGWSVVRVVMVPDDEDCIAAELRILSSNVELVFTTGGIGPTLDDVTMAGVAKAFNKGLVRHPGLEARLRSYFGDDLSQAHLKMADMPEGESELLEYYLEDSGELSKFPVLRCRNTYVLPGVPFLLRQKWKAIKGFLTGLYGVKPFHNQTFRLSLSDETIIASALQQVSRVHGPHVCLGSYPVTKQEDGAQILLTLDSKLAESIDRAAVQLRKLLPPGCIIKEEEDVRSLLRASSTTGL